MLPYFSLSSFKIGPLNVYVLGLFMALGAIVSFLYALRVGKKQGLSSDLIFNLFAWILVGIVLGARTGFIIQFPNYYLKNPMEVFSVTEGGITFYGGLFGGFLAFCLYFRIKKLSSNLFWKTADLIALSLPLGIIVGRIGCFLLNDHQGRETNLPWGIIWPDGVVRHPVALYLILNGAILFIVLNAARKYLKKSGQIFWFFLFLYGLIRFLLDFTRSKETLLSDPSFLIFSFPQWISLATGLFAGYWLWRRGLSQ